MKKNHITRDSIIVGLALFSTMFGAGNLIFPPQIGLADGTQWGWGALGIVLTGVILPVLAFWGVNNVGTDVKCLRATYTLSSTTFTTSLAVFWWARVPPCPATAPPLTRWACWPSSPMCPHG